MAKRPTGVIGGVDCHSRTHHAVALDDGGRRLADAAFPASAQGYRALHRWLAGFGEIVAVGVESSSAYGARLTRWLTGNGLQVLEVNQPHKHISSRGKSDPIDAEAAARKVVAGDVQVVPKDTTGIVESVRQLRVAREGAVKARSAALCQLGDLIVTTPPELRESLPRKTLLGRRDCARSFVQMHGDWTSPLHAAKFALRSLALRVADLDSEIRRLDQALRELVGRAAPRTTALLGVGIQHAGQLLVTAGENIGRLRNEAAFAQLCAAAPIPASSGLTHRHRLNPGGDRWQTALCI